MTTPRPVMLYGLRVRSELPLHQERWAPDDGTADDVVIRMGDEMASTEQPPPGRVLLDFEFGRRFYCATATDDGHYVLRCHRVTDFVVDGNLRDVTVHRVATTDLEYASVLATGTLLSFILAMLGEVVLHASAVQVGDAAVAFVGSSGMGKSTMAALLCGEGGALITDDVLRLQPDDSGGLVCRLGATELRLRKSAGDLADRFDGDLARRRTIDDRDALGLPSARVDHLPLRAIVIPRPDHTGGTEVPEVTRLDPMQALLMMVRFPRILGWKDKATLDAHFHQLAEVVDRVDVHVADMPWGPPFPDDVATLLLDELGLDLTRSDA